MTSRRRLLAAAATAALAGTARAGAEPAPLAKSQVSYRDVPNNGQVCAQCVYFLFKPASAGQTPASRCKLVAGPINPAGWCDIWAPAR